MLKKYIIPFIVVVAVYACSTPHEQSVNEIKILKKKLDSTERVYAKIDLDGVQEMYNKVNSDMEYVKQNISKFNMADTSISRYIGQYSTLYKTLGRTFKKKGALSLGDEIDVCKTQLNNLQSDIKNGFLTDSTVIQKHLSNERSVVSITLKKVEVVYQQCLVHFEAYDEIYPKVVKIINETKVD